MVLAPIRYVKYQRCKVMEGTMWIFSDESLKVNHRPINDYDKMRLTTLGAPGPLSAHTIGLGLDDLSKTENIVRDEGAELERDPK